MADAKAVTFQTETPAKQAAARAAVVAAEAAKPAAVASPSETPKPGDKFVPERGKVGVWHALGGEAAGMMAAIITH